MPAPGSKSALIAPLFLRLAVGLTFVWAGAGKLLVSVEYSGQQAAILANIGAGVAPTRVKSEPTNAAPKLAPPNALPIPEKPKSDSGHRADPDGYASPILGALQPAFPELVGTTKHKQPAGKNAAPKPVEPTFAPRPVEAKPAEPTLPPGGIYTSTDFPTPIKARRAYQVALILVSAAHPEKGSAYWPARLAGEPWVTYLAFGTGVVELVCGGMVLIGFFTRPASVLLAVTMLGALWLTQLGPSISTGNTMLGVLPNRDWSDPSLWTIFFWQLSLLGSTLALALLGAGAASIDRAVGAVAKEAAKAPPPKQ